MAGFLLIFIVLACLTSREGGTGYFSKAIVAHLAPLPASSLGGSCHDLASHLVLFLVSLICRATTDSSTRSPVLVPQERTRLLLPLGPCGLLQIVDLFFGSCCFARSDVVLKRQNEIAGEFELFVGSPIQ